MKKIKKIKLIELSKEELEEREMKILKGGDYCDDKCGTVSPSHASSSGWWKGHFE